MEYRNSDMKIAIDEYVHNTRYREILRLRYCEGMARIKTMQDMVR